MKKEINQDKCRVVLSICFLAEVIGLLVVQTFSSKIDINTITDHTHIGIYLYSLMMIILMVVMLSFFRQHNYTYGKYYFSLAGLVLYIILIGGLVDRLIAEKPEFVDLRFAVQSSLWILDTVLLLFVCLFFTSSFEMDGETIKKRWIKVTCAFMLITVALVAVNVPTHFAFYISDAGKYVSKPASILLQAPTEIVVVYSFFMIFKMKTSVKERIIQFIYVLVPTGTYIIQSDPDAIFSYYLSLFIAYIFAYCNIIVLRERDIAVTDAIKANRQKEIDMTAEIQANMLAKDFSLSNTGDIDLYAKMTPAKEVGGDFYDCFSIDDNKIAVVIADVSGKGIPASLFMSVGKTMISKGLRDGESVSEVFTSVHRIMVENNDRSMFITAFAAIIDTNENTMTYCNAGHCLPLIMTGDSNYEFVNDRHGPMLGCMLAKNHTYTESKTDFVEGDALYIYTDGVDEAHNSNGELFGKDRLLEAINKKLDLSARDTIEYVEKNVQDFVDKQTQFDDITMLCIKRIVKENTR